MKNVAKCDTWCELQNPVNHRVFERKLRPKPRPRARLPGCHATSPPPPTTPPRERAVRGRGRMLASRARSPRARGWPKRESSAPGARASGGRSRPCPVPLRTRRPVGLDP
ncbi:hypothetical protein SLA2020_245170 [Shorea laevis]